MSLEKRITDALHQTDDYEPSIDLFARLSRSIEEDKAHRGRVRRGTAAVMVGVGILGGFLITLAGQDPDGVPVLPKWSIQVVVLALLTSCLVAFGPAISRLGRPYLADVFHMSPATGARFSRLLDIAYYLFFSGGILSILDLTEFGSLVPAGESLGMGAGQVALFLTGLGLAHAANLFLLPIVGLLFGSVTRRARRRVAGSQAPPVSPRALKADRLATSIMFTAVILAIGGGLLITALMVAGI